MLVFVGGAPFYSLRGGGPGAARLDNHSVNDGQPGDGAPEELGDSDPNLQRLGRGRAPHNHGSEDKNRLRAYPACFLYLSWQSDLKVNFVHCSCAGGVSS